MSQKETAILVFPVYLCWGCCHNLYLYLYFQPVVMMTKLVLKRNKGLPLLLQCEITDEDSNFDVLVYLCWGCNHTLYLYFQLVVVMTNWFCSVTRGCLCFLAVEPTGRNVHLLLWCDVIWWDRWRWQFRSSLILFLSVFVSVIVFVFLASHQEEMCTCCYEVPDGDDNFGLHQFTYWGCWYSYQYSCCGTKLCC